MGETLDKQVSELEDYVKLSNYAKEVLDKFPDIDKISTNDIYDVMYIKESIEYKLSKGVDNASVMDSLTDSLNRIDVIIKLFNDDIVKKAYDNREKADNIDKDKSRDINIAKYGNSNFIDKYRSKRISGEKDIGIILSFFFKRFALMGIFGIFHIFTKFVRAEDTVLNGIESLCDILAILIIIIIFLLTIVDAISIVVFDKEEKDVDSTILSDRARNLLYAYNNNAKYKVDKADLDAYDRIDLAESLLTNMYDSRGDVCNRGTIRKVEDIKKTLEKTDKNSLEYITNLVKAEILYINNSSVFDNAFKRLEDSMKKDVKDAESNLKELLNKLYNADKIYRNQKKIVEQLEEKIQVMGVIGENVDKDTGWTLNQLTKQLAIKRSELLQLETSLQSTKSKYDTEKLKYDSLVAR